VRGALSVLVVDDDSGIRDSLAECLESEGYRVNLAQNGAEGIERVRERRPDLIVVDLFMPVMNGYQFLAELRTDPTAGAIPVVLMTGAAPRTGSSLPAVDAVLPKPFELEDLLAVVRRLGR
jgi:two-component system, chemotaxis family, chemotaxis protein CheY